MQSLNSYCTNNVELDLVWKVRKVNIKLIWNIGVENISVQFRKNQSIPKASYANKIPAWMDLVLMSPMK